MSAAERREQRRAERFHKTVEAQLAEIESLRGTQARAERELAEYLNDPDWPERRETFDDFEAAGGKTSRQWAAWLKGEWPRKSIVRRRLRRGPRLVWTNPNPPAKRADPKQRKS